MDLDPEQKQLAPCQSLRGSLSTGRDDPNLMSRIISGDERWVSGYDSDQTAVFAVEEPTVSKTKEGASGQEPTKSMLIIFFDIRGVVHRKFLPQDQTVTIIAPHPYLPDLTPCDFFLFPKMKFKLNGRRFDTVEEIQRESQMVLDALMEQDF